MDIIGLARTTWYYRHNPRRKTTGGNSCRYSPKTLSDKQRQRVRELLEQGRGKGLSVSRVFYDHLDSDEPLVGSLRTFYRIEKQRRLDRGISTSTHRKIVCKIPVVVADKPGQVLCWDITWLPASFVSKGFHLDTVLDLYSRKIVGYTVQPRQDKDIVKQLIEQVIVDFKTSGHRVDVVHTDNGKVMTSSVMKTMLGNHNVELSLIRPSVSNDNAFEEASHRTVKHHRLARETYRDIDQANAVVAAIVDQYNNFDRHSGLYGYTPQEVFSGAWVKILAHRRRKEDEYYARHPQRRPKKSAYVPPPSVVGINAGSMPEVENFSPVA